MADSNELKKAVVDISGVALNAALIAMSASAPAASVAVILGKAGINHIWKDKKSKSPPEKYRTLISNAVRGTMPNYLTGEQYYDERADTLAQVLFSSTNAAYYLEADDAFVAFCAVLEEQLAEGFLDAEALRSMAADIVTGVYAGVRNDTDLLSLITYDIVHANHGLLLEILDAVKGNADELAQKADPWLTEPPAVPTPYYVDRKEYAEIIEALDKEGAKICICGMGGLGKTELMRKVCEQTYKRYPYAAWVSYTDSLRSSLVRAFKGMEGVSEEEAFDMIVDRIGRMGSDLILFIDNLDAKKKDDGDLCRLEKMGATVLITGRRHDFSSHFRDYTVGYLSDEKAEELFVGYLDRDVAGGEQEVLAKIISLAGGHTLSLELIAKSAKKRGHLLEKVLAELLENGFDIKGNVHTAHGEDREAQTTEHLSRLYNISDFAEDEQSIYILQCFSLLEYIPLSYDDTMKALGVGEEAVLDLADLGWLEKSEVGFSMHSVIRDVVIRNAGELDELCDYFIDRMIEESDRRYSTKLAFLPHLVAISKRYTQTNEIKGNLYSAVAMIYLDMGNFSEALKWQLEIKEMLEALYRDSLQPDVATSYNNLSILYKNLGILQEALNWQQEAKRINLGLYGDGPHPDMATNFNNLSMIYQDMGNLPEAMKWQQEATYMKEVLYGDEPHPDIATSYNNLSTIYYTMGNLSEALKWQQKAKKMREVLCEEDTLPDMGMSYSNLAMIYKDMGNLSEAMKWQQKAKEINETIYGDVPHPDTAKSYNNLSMIYLDIGDLPEAMRWQQKALGMKGELYGDRPHPEMATSLSNLSTIFYGMRDFSNAMKWQQEAKRMNEALYGEAPHPDTAMSYNNLSGIYHATGNLPEALKWQQEAQRMNETLYGDAPHPDMVTSYNNLSGIYQDMGNVEKAAYWYEAATEMKGRLEALWRE